MATPAAAGNPVLSPGLSIIHSNHLEDLRRVAVQWIASHPLAPLENEVFIVHSNGMAQWLKLALAENDGCGISAALDIQLPARFLWTAYRAVLGAAEIPVDSPYDKDRLTWRLLRLLPGLMKDERFVRLKAFLADDRDMRKRYQLACHLADLYDQYQVYRADWLEDWTKGADRLRSARGKPLDLPAGHRWQAELWRRIQADVPGDRRKARRSALHRRFLRKAGELTRRPAGLPRRVIVFGISSLPAQALEALHALAAHSQVLLFVLNPCRHYWADIIEDRNLLRIERSRHRRKDRMPADLDPERLHQHVNPLLAAWGKQGRDYIGLLYGYDQPEAYRKRFAEIDLFTDFVPGSHTGSLLQQVQQAILDLAPLPAEDAKKPGIARKDTSICFHLAHSRQREVEILQDQLLSFFETIPDLTPRDVIVMTPDIALYAPQIESVFGNLPSEDPRYIPYTIADRPERASAPLRTALERLLQLPESRLAVSDLMGLLEVPALRNRFGLTEHDLPRLHQWVMGAGIRWGLNADQRQSFGLPSGLEQNTWAFGLRRMLLGYAAGAGSPWQGIEPYDEIGGLEAVLVGPLAALLEQLEKHRQVLNRPATADDWVRRILDLLQDCFRPGTGPERLTLSRMKDALAAWQTACNDAALKAPLPLAVVRDTLLAAMQASSMSQRFLAGMVNFGTLMPMRAIPFKVVCLLGMNDDAYPRSYPRPDFDLMAAPECYRPGDRSRREDDRYLFLEALLSAREKLYISYIGRSVRDNAIRMPSVLVGQLRDYLAAGWRPAADAPDAEGAGRRLLDRLTCQHPLQPFSRAYFEVDRPPDLFTYAHEWREVLDEPATAPGPSDLAAPSLEGSLQLTALTGFLKNPVQFFFNQRLNVYFDPIGHDAQDQEPFALDRLAPFVLGDRLLQAGLSVPPGQRETAVRQAAGRLQHTGDLPLKGFGELAAAELATPVQGMLKNTLPLEAAWPHAIDPIEINLDIPLDKQTHAVVEDWLDGLRQTDVKPPRYARWTYYHRPLMDRSGQVSRPDSLVGLWVRHLAGCAQGLCLTCCLVAPDGVARLRPLDRDTAQKQLTDLVVWCLKGLQRPLPVTARTALVYLRGLPTGSPEMNSDGIRQKAQTAARQAYQGNGYHSAGEVGYNAYLARAYPDYDALYQADNHLFLHLAEVLYAPLLNALQEAP